MPVYEYYCRECGTKFEKLRSISAANEPIECPDGHEGAIRTLSVIARVGGSDGEFGFGGCGCGGACACGAAS
jgi:putative FmdB family regulatory protein